MLDFEQPSLFVIETSTERINVPTATVLACDTSTQFNENCRR
jgi:hypothetical protein